MERQRNKRGWVERKTRSIVPEGKLRFKTSAQWNHLTWSQLTSLPSVMAVRLRKVGHNHLCASLHWVVELQSSCSRTDFCFHLPVCLSMTFMIPLLPLLAIDLPLEVHWMPLSNPQSSTSVLKCIWCIHLSTVPKMSALAWHIHGVYSDSEG